MTTLACQTPPISLWVIGTHWSQEEKKTFWSCRIKQLLRSSYRMRGNRGSNGWGHFFFCRHGQPFSMFSKVDQTGTLSWLTDKTQQFRIIDRCWRLMSHKTAYVGKRLCCCCCCTNESSLKPSRLSGEFWQATLSFASNSLIVIFFFFLHFRDFFARHYAHFLDW